MDSKNILAASFINAINIEQKADSLATDEYLAKYSPKKLAQFGLAVVNLVISNLRTGLGGKTLIELSVDSAVSNPDDDINPGSIRVGDIVKLSKMDNKKTSSDEKDNLMDVDAVVTKVSSKFIAIAVDEDSSDEKILNLYNNTGNDSTKVWIVKLANSVTYKRMISSLNKLIEFKGGNQIIDLLLGNTKYILPQSSPSVKSFFDANLNDSQKSAIEFALSSPLTIIHGPPGTGKTYTLIELIKQLSFNKNERVLVCGPSNISVDTILERLSAVFTNDEVQETSKKKRSSRNSDKKSLSPEKLIRIGHPARLLPTNLAHSLDVLSKTNYGSGNTDSKEILLDLQKEISETLGKIKKCKRYSERRVLWSDLKVLKKDLREREKKVTEELLMGAKVILSTLHGAGAYELTSLYKTHAELDSESNPLFDTIIIDEVSQSLEPQCWIPIINHIGAKRLIIAGDNMQLPPTVKSNSGDLSLSKLNIKDKNGEESVADLEFTLFDRLVQDLDGNLYKKLLDTQYRMNAKIMKFPSEELYDGKLKAHKSVADITLSQLPNVNMVDETENVCIWYDTQGGDFPEKSTDNENNDIIGSGGSKFNELEALLCIQHVEKLLNSGVKSEHIGIISPYNAQVSLLKKSLNESTSIDADSEVIEISTVDGFQGREKDAIIVSLVRSNDNREVGFLRDKRRLNVAITRPKRQLCIIGDLELMQKSGVQFLKNWGEFAEDEFEIRYPQLDDY
ncbi:DNA polymerase alpha-associated DNA helicase A [[Candida] railenensis]|uniref:DNA helicase n=1 Tax=[Candida] railenensis TaxID=45579 RepID=A0A9P0QUL3_9ASCO|nr:DNA polymerase alpha-associated DNA helicase A [[Candida] railenensis]